MIPANHRHCEGLACMPGCISCGNPAASYTHKEGTLTAAAPRAFSRTSMPIVHADRVADEPVSWLWPNMIPLGKLVILDGDPDVGKSLIALDWCARLSTGRPFPDGQPSPGPCNALVLSAEDKASDTIVPRLRHLGADLSRIAVWQHDGDDEA